MATTARNVMTRDVITVSPSTPLVDVARMFSEDKISGAPVVDDTDRLVGILSRTDVITGLLESRSDGATNLPEMRSLLGIAEAEESESEDGGDVPEPEAACGPIVEEVMDGDPVTVAPDAPLADVARRMARDRLHRVVVVDDGRVVGILTSIDLLGQFPGAATAPKGSSRAPKRASLAKGKTVRAPKAKARVARRRVGAKTAR